MWSLAKSMLLLGLVAAMPFADIHAHRRQDPPKKYALLIGVDSYDRKGAMTALTAAGADAQSLAKCLEDVAGFKGNVEVLTSTTDIRPTNTDILYELSTIANKAGPDDTVVFFFSGHGVEIGDGIYLLPTNADPRTPDTLKASSVNVLDLQKVLAGFKPKHLTLIYDMCRTDPFQNKKDAKSIHVSKKITDSLTAQPVPGKEILTYFACSPEQSSYEWLAKKRGYYSWYLEQGLRGAAADEHGNVTAASLQVYVRKQVLDAVKHFENADQEPFWVQQGNDPGNTVWASGVAPNVPVAGPKISQNVSRLLRQAEQQVAVLDTEQAKSSYDDALSAARTSGDRAGEAFVLISRSQFWAGQGIEACLDDANQARSAAISAKEKVIEARADSVLATLYLNKKQPADAEARIREAATLYRELGDKQGQAVAQQLLGTILVQLTKYEAASVCYGSASELFSETDPLRSARNIVLEGSSFVGAGKVDDAVKAYDRAVQACLKTKNTDLVMLALDGLAAAQQKLGQLAKARAAFESGLQSFADDSVVAAFCHDRLGRIAIATGDVSLGESQLQKAKEIVERAAPKSPLMIDILLDLGKSSVHHGESGLQQAKQLWGAASQLEIELRPKGAPQGETLIRDLENSSKQTVVASTTPTKRGKDYAIVVGISDYTYLPRLANPASDARSLASFLQRDFGFVTTVLSNPTRETLIRALADSRNMRLAPEDQLLIFFAGHAFYDPTFHENYLMLRESQAPDQDPTHATALSFTELSRVADSLAARHVLLLMDASVKVEIARTFALEDLSLLSAPKSTSTLCDLGPSDSTQMNRFFQRVSRQILSAGDGAVEDGPPGDHSPFVQAILSGLTDIKPGEFLTAFQLYSRVEMLRSRPIIANFASGESGGNFIFFKSGKSGS